VKLPYQPIIVVLGAGLFLLYAARTNADRDQVKEPDFNVARELNLHSGPPVVASNSMRIVSWNIDHGAHLDTLSSELEKNPADLCLFQEVDWNAVRSGEKDVGAELARRFHLSMAYGVEFEELSQERGRAACIGQATLSRFSIRRSRVLRFARQSGFWKPHVWIPSNLPLMQRRLGSRIALVTDLDWNGKLFVVYNAHLESRSFGPIQIAQLDEMLADLKTYPPGTAAVIGGDLNSKYLPSIFLRKLQREGFRSALGDKIERTHAIAMALDWIFVRGPFEWSGGVVRRDLKGSDHYPIYATLALKH
jgi:endonuclease/exonuclease/phosphatase family metal-dependent hydrolase